MCLLSINSCKQSNFHIIQLFFHSTKDLWKSLARLDGVIHEILKTWQSQNIDVLIAPGFAFPAPPVKHPARLTMATSYTHVYNVLNFPVGTLPVSRVISEDEVNLLSNIEKSEKSRQ